MGSSEKPFFYSIWVIDFVFSRGSFFLGGGETGEMLPERIRRGRQAVKTKGEASHQCIRL